MASEELSMKIRLDIGSSMGNSEGEEQSRVEHRVNAKQFEHGLIRGIIVFSIKHLPLATAQPSSSRKDKVQA